MNIPADEWVLLQHLLRVQSLVATYNEAILFSRAFDVWKDLMRFLMRDVKQTEEVWWEERR